MTDSVEKKKKLRVEGVQYTEVMKEYAAAVEQTMLAMIDDGYAVELHEQDDGVLLLGTLRAQEEEEHPFVRYMRGLASRSSSTSPYTVLGARSAELYQRFETILDASHDLKAFAEEAKKQSRLILSGFNVEEITTSVSEFEKEAEAHAKSCKRPPGGCMLPEMMRAIAEILKDTAKTQLQ